MSLFQLGGSVARQSTSGNWNKAGLAQEEDFGCHKPSPSLYLRALGLSHSCTRDPCLVPRRLPQNDVELGGNSRTHSRPRLTEHFQRQSEIAFQQETDKEIFQQEKRPISDTQDIKSLP